MKLSKYLHSCLLVNDNHRTVIIDPGIFTYQEKALPIDSLTQLDAILITHEHFDHMCIPFIKELVEKFPQIQIISSPSISKILEKEKFYVHTDLSALPKDLNIHFEEISHEQLWDKSTVSNIVFTIFDKLTHPGDSHHITSTKEILALPLLAPWGSTKAAVELALNLKPKIIIPIHDWMWKDEVRKDMYQRLQVFFREKGIDFKSIETGETVEI